MCATLMPHHIHKQASLTCRLSINLDVKEHLVRKAACINDETANTQKGGELEKGERVCDLQPVSLRSLLRPP